MQITNELSLPLPPAEAWPVLLDLEKIAPCLPGAVITGVDGDVFEGKAKVKVGPITAEYRGSARFVERDETAYRAVIRATGKDARGQGNVAANIAAHLVPHGAGSKVIVETELDISGKLAQFGRGVINDAASAILKTFADRLGELLAGRTTAANAGRPETPAARSSTTAQTGAAPFTDEALDLLKVAKQARAERAGRTESPIGWVPALVAVAAALVSIFAAGYAAGAGKR